MVYNLLDLQKECQKGRIHKFLFFWGHTPQKDGKITETCLSQWWKCNFQVDQILYSCAEQYMMAEKARLFQDEEMLEQIMKAEHPKIMKEFGRAVKNFEHQIWEENCFEIVKRGNKAKFSQNPDLWNYLKSTGTRILVEASPRDRIWGIGLGKSNPDAENPMKWRGENLLGFAITQVRDQLLLEI